MTRLCHILIVVLIGARAAAAADVQSITFAATAANGRPLTLTGKLTRPTGGGAFPAIVLMHGCAGLRAWGDMWANRLTGWGYVVLRPDSFRRRGARDCAKGTATVDIRAKDAHAARKFLATRRFVDRKRIGVMGMSHGGTAALISVCSQAGSTAERETFEAVVTLYPRCYQARAETVEAPVLILIGDSDHLAPATACETLGTRGGNRHELEVVVYPKATHAFDWENLDMAYFGQRIRYNPEAAADAVPRIRAFLDLYMGRR